MQRAGSRRGKIQAPCDRVGGIWTRQNVEGKPQVGGASGQRSDGRHVQFRK